jgi:protease-4
VLVSAGAVTVLTMLAGPTVEVPSNATLQVKIEAPFPEIEPMDVIAEIFNRSATLRQTVDLIHRAKTDSRIAGLVIRPTGSGGLWAQLQEVRAAVEDFKTSKKPVTAFLESADIGEYYVASAADRIVLMPAGQLDVAGLASYELFFRGALDKLGLFPDLLHIGDYKTASNTFTETHFTPAHREMTASLNRDWYDEVVRGIAAGRKIADADARAAIDAGPYLADEALRAHLVDALSYEDQLDDTAPIQGTREITGEQYAKAPAAPAPAGGRIAVLYAVGTIASGKSSFDAPSGVVLGSESFNDWVRKVRVDPGIRAVVVRVDSPGGSAIASEVMWRELMLTRQVKPLVVSMGDVAASGGYYIAAPADTIVAEPGTLTGSIGVVTGKFVMQGTLDKFGVGTGSVSDGRLAEIYSPFRKFSDQERARIEEQLQSTYELFLKRVADGRHQTPAKIDSVAQGRVWTGRQAREIGLVDEIGGLDDAIRIAKQRAKLDPAQGVSLEVYPPRRTIYDVISRSFGTSASAGLDLLLHRPEARAVDSTLSLLQRFRRGEPLAIMPNVFVH